MRASCLDLSEILGRWLRGSVRLGFLLKFRMSDRRSIVIEFTSTRALSMNSSRSRLSPYCSISIRRGLKMRIISGGTLSRSISVDDMRLFPMESNASKMSPRFSRSLLCISRSDFLLARTTRCFSSSSSSFFLNSSTWACFRRRSYCPS